MFRTSNPAFARQPEFAPAQTWDDLRDQGRMSDIPAAGGAPSPAAAKAAGYMTVQGTVNKTFFLLALCVITAVVGWNLTMSANPVVSPALVMIGGAIAGLITGLVCAFAPRTSPVTAPLYSIFQGFFVGGVSAVYAQRFAVVNPETGASTLNTGMVINAALLTFGILAGLLVAYSAKLIRPSRTFNNVVIAGTFGVCIYGLVAMVASMFGAPSLASVYDPNNGGMISIGFSVLLVALASANLVLDFQFIEQGAAHRAPRYMEWYGGFGLMVTLVWLYLEVLRLLAKLRRE